MRFSWLVLTSILVTSAAAQAEDRGVPTADWSIGAGIGTTSVLSLGSLSSLGQTTAAPLGLSTPLLTYPSAVLQVERRLASKTWLLGQLNLSGTTNNEQLHGGTPGYDQLVAVAGSSFNFQASIGVRQVVLQVWRVSLSGYALLTGTYAQSSTNQTTNEQFQGQDPAGDFVTLPYQQRDSVATQSWGVGIQVGIDADLQLLDNLVLRIGSGLVNAGYARGFAHDQPTPVGTLPPEVTLSAASSDAGGFSGGLALSPSLLLRLLF